MPFSAASRRQPKCFAVYGSILFVLLSSPLIVCQAMQEASRNGSFSPGIAVSVAIMSFPLAAIIGGLIGCLVFVFMRLVCYWM